MVHMVHMATQPKCVGEFVDIVDVWTMQFKSLYPILKC